MKIDELKPLLISQLNTGNIGGGSELFTNQLEYYFPNLKVADINLLKQNPNDESLRVKYLTEFIAKNMNLQKFDFIITLGIGAWYFNKLKIKNLKILNFYHGNWLGFRNHCYSFFNPKYHYISLKKIPYEKMSGKNAVNIAVSKFVKKYVQKEGPKNVEIVYNTSFLNVEKKSEDYILFIGRPTKEKGFDIFLEMVKAFPKEKFVALILSNKRLRDIPTNLIIHYNFPYEKINTIYERAKLLLHPSLFEGNSYVILEAWKSNIPVIASNVGLIWELHKIPGIKLLKHNKNSYINGIKEFLNNGTQLSPREFFNNNFSSEIVREQWERVLEQYL